MRLFTHNMLQCHVKGCNTNNFPLRFSQVELDTQEAEFNADFLVNFLPRIDWPALMTTTSELGLIGLPDSVPQDVSNDRDSEFLQTLHKVLMETRVKEGVMECPNCKHAYTVKNGIANMLLQEHEV